VKENDLIARERFCGTAKKTDSKLTPQKKNAADQKEHWKLKRPLLQA
jgi:hypothetical protein